MPAQIDAQTRVALADRLAALLDNLSEESAYHLEDALRAAESSVAGGSVVIDIPRKPSDHLIVRWLGGARKLTFEA